MRDARSQERSEANARALARDIVSVERAVHSVEALRGWVAQRRAARCAQIEAPPAGPAQPTALGVHRNRGHPALRAVEHNGPPLDARRDSAAIDAIDRVRNAQRAARYGGKEASNGGAPRNAPFRFALRRRCERRLRLGEGVVCGDPRAGAAASECDAPTRASSADLRD